MSLRWPPTSSTSIATTYKRTVTDVVCDNTREAALAESGQAYKVKHSRYSHAKLAPAREALALVHTLADEFAAEISRLCSIPVTPAQWTGSWTATALRG
jgi:hypothetical protein